MIFIDFPAGTHPVAAILAEISAIVGLLLVFGWGIPALVGIIIPEKWWKRSQK